MKLSEVIAKYETQTIVTNSVDMEEYLRSKLPKRNVVRKTLRVLLAYAEDPMYEKDMANVIYIATPDYFDSHILECSKLASVTGIPIAVARAK